MTTQVKSVDEDNSPKLISLLQDDIVSSNPDWKTTLAPKKLFYIRGYSWFRQAVGDVTKLGHDDQTELIAKMHEIVSSRSEWSELGLGSKSSFSFRLQVNEALGSKRSPQRLEKALGTLAICEAFFEKRRQERPSQVEPVDIYSRMRIQPACFYISNFTSELVEKIRTRQPMLLSKLEEATGQLRHAVFFEMALSNLRNGKLARKLVTRELAEGTYSALKEVLDADEKLNSLDPGRVSCVYDASIARQTASDSEYIRF